MDRLQSMYRARRSPKNACDQCDRSGTEFAARAPYEMPSGDNLNKAINIMHEKGWRCVNVSYSRLQSGFAGSKTDCLALMEKRR